MVPGQNVRIIQGMAIFFITCSFMAVTVSAGCSSQLFPGLGGCCSDPCCEQNQSLCLFGGPCNERVTMVSLGMTGARFSGTPTSGPSPLQVQFTANSGPEIASWSWDFGDGSYGSGMNPVHTYTSPGTYTVKLTVRQGQANVNYQTSTYFAWGQESTWQKEAMIQVTGPVSTGNLVSSDQKGALTPVTGIIQAGNPEQSGQFIQYQPAMYQTSTPWKAHTLTYQRGKISPRASGLTSWKTGVV
jgi:hypothetical protein